MLLPLTNFYYFCDTWKIIYPLVLHAKKYTNKAITLKQLQEKL